MSADRWSICPKCKKEHEKQIQNLQKVVQTEYGILSREEFLDILQSLEKGKKRLENENEVEQTLREDYKIITDEDGVFHVNYTCSCTLCHFTHNFNHEEELIK